MKKIVSPTNFSADSLNAVNYAADLACVLSMDLVLFYVCPIPLPVSEVPIAEYSAMTAQKDAEERIAHLKEEIVDRTGGRIRVSTQVNVGDVVTGIKELCTTVHPYAVVMGAESMNAFERFLFHGITVSAVKELAWPVIIVPPSVKFSSIRRICLACDLEQVISVLPYNEIRSLVHDFKAELHVLHVLESGQQAPAAGKKAEAVWLKEMLNEFHPHYHYVHAANIDEGITGYAEKNHFDLLIILPRKNNLIQQLFIRSHSKQVVLHTQVPLLSIHE